MFAARSRDSSSASRLDVESRRLESREELTRTGLSAPVGGNALTLARLATIAATARPSLTATRGSGDSGTSSGRGGLAQVSFFTLSGYLQKQKRHSKLVSVPGPPPGVDADAMPRHAGHLGLALLTPHTKTSVLPRLPASGSHGPQFLTSWNKRWFSIDGPYFCYHAAKGQPELLRVPVTSILSVRRSTPVVRGVFQ